jgi:hypothetical protein
LLLSAIAYTSKWSDDYDFSMRLPLVINTVKVGVKYQSINTYWKYICMLVLKRTILYKHNKIWKSISLIFSCLNYIRGNITMQIYTYRLVKLHFTTEEFLSCYFRSSFQEVRYHLLHTTVPCHIYLFPKWRRHTDTEERSVVLK